MKNPFVQASERIKGLASVLAILAIVHPASAGSSEDGKATAQPESEEVGPTSETWTSLLPAGSANGHGPQQTAENIDQSPAPAPRLKHFTLFFGGQWKNTSDHSDTEGSTNFFIAEVCFVSQENRFEGRVIQNGAASKDVGFKVGDLYWIATDLDMDKGIVSGQVNFRSGRGGITENSWWVPFEILLEESYMDTRVEVSEQPGRPGEYRLVMARHGPAAACPATARP